MPAGHDLSSGLDVLPGFGHGRQLLSADLGVSLRCERGRLSGGHRVLHRAGHDDQTMFAAKPMRLSGRSVPARLRA